VKARNQSLDILRGVAILLVLGCHYDYCRAWYKFGWSGVDLFFVLSGFLISGLLFAEFKKTGRINLKRFWLRRGLKIWPAFYAFIGFTVGVLLLYGHRVPHDLLHDSLFISNYLTPYWRITWSLAVEEHFYLALPILLLILVRISREKANPFRAIPAIAIALTAVCLVLRALARGPQATGAAETHLRMDSLFFGVALGYYYHFEREKMARIGRWPLSICAGSFLALVLVISLVHGPTNEPVIYTFAFLGYGCLLLAMLDRQPSRGPLSGLVAWIGRYSYSIYLWHIALVAMFFWGIRPTALTFVIYVIASLLVGAGMSKAIEYPVLALRDRWLPAASKTPLEYAVPRLSLQRFQTAPSKAFLPTPPGA
jgi:peptidoglycan/LPS O-acetylase OafA/YrhL